ncbi:MAG TPA: protein kinase [Verrucomicrobiae bacterium]|nr:protein kinase [Verrucomicrobiae bacterium]
MDAKKGHKTAITMANGSSPQAVSSENAARCERCQGIIYRESQDGCAQCLFSAALYAEDTPPQTEGAGDLTTILLKPVSSRGVEFYGFGDYQLMEEIARGGMGVVFKARQISLNRVVALKFIHPGKLLSAEAVRRFEIEAEAAARLDHPRIIPIYEVGQHAGQYWFSMKLVDGGTLAQPPPRLRTDVTAVVKLLITVARAVHYAHQRGILHRDLKPGNILLDEQGQPFVTDFSLAKLLAQDSSVTLSGQVVGTPSYMAPEAAAGHVRTLTTATDIYGLGAIFYELLTGRPPFKAENVPALLRKVSEEDPVPPSRVAMTQSQPAGADANPDQTPPGTAWSRGAKAMLAPWPKASIDQDLETICLRCLEKDPARRYASADALADDLERWLHHEPIWARRSTSRERLIKWARRQPVLASALALLVMVLVLGIAGIVWQWSRAEAARRQAIRGNLELGKALNQMDAVTLQRTEELAEQGQQAEALPWLAMLLHNNPSNRIVAERVLSTLSRGTWAHLACPPLIHSNRVNSAAVAKDGTRILTIAENTAWLWDARTGNSLRSFVHDGELATAEFSPEGHWVATGAEDGKVRVWRAETGQPQTSWLEHTAPVRSISFSADETQLAVGCTDGTVRIWNIQDGSQVAPPKPHAAKIIFAQFVPGGSLFVTAASEPVARVWDLRAQRVQVELVHPGRVDKLAISPDGHLAATATTNAVYLWELPSGQRIGRSMTHQGRVWDIEFSPDGQRLVTASADKTAAIWDAHTGQRIGQPLQHQDAVRAARFSPEGLRVVTASWDWTSRVWDAATGEPLTEPMPHPARVFHVEFDAAGTKVVSASNSRFVLIWHVPGRAPLPPPMVHGHRVKMATFNADSSLLLTASADGTARFWDALTCLPVGSPMRHTRELNYASFSRDGRWAVTGGDDGVARIWEVPSGRPVTELLRHNAQIHWISFSFDSRWIATASSDRTARVWDTRTGNAHGAPLEVGSHVHSVTFSPDGKLLLTASGQGRAQLWDFSTGRPHGSPMQHADKVLRAIFSPDGRKVLTASADGTARLWDTVTSQALTPPLQHAGEVRDADFSPDGQRVVTSSLDKSARVWDAQTGQPLAPPYWHDGWVLSARFSPNGRWLATVCTDGYFAVWDMATGGRAAKSLHHKRVPRSAEFSPDGTSLVVAGEDEQAVLWPLCLPPGSAAPALADLAEGVVGKRFDQQGTLIPVNPPDLWAAQESLRRTEIPDRFYASWARWLLSESNSRAVWPFSPHTRAEYVERLLQIATPTAIREAARVAPADGRVLAHLALLLVAEDPAENPRARGDADWLSRRALALVPGYAPALDVQAILSKEASPRAHE